MRRLLGLISLILPLSVLFAETSRENFLETIARREALLNTSPERLLGKEEGIGPLFFKHHLILFFFSSTCTHCHQQAPALKRWAQQQGAIIEARSFDDKPLLEFPTVLPATKALVETAFQETPIRYPALFVMNQKTNAIYPVAIGALTEEELETRFSALIPKIIAHEEGVHP